MPTKAKKPQKTIRRPQGIFTGNIIISYVVMVLLAFGAVFLYFSPPLKPISQLPKLNNFDTIERFSNGATLRQTFVAPMDADSFGIFLRNYEVFLEDGYFDITIFQGAREIFNQSISTAQLINNQFFYLDCRLIAGSTYTLTLNIRGLEDKDNVSFMTTNAADGDLLAVDGSRQSYSLVFSYVQHVPDYFAIWYCIFGIALLLTYVVIFINKEAYGSAKTKAC